MTTLQFIQQPNNTFRLGNFLQESLRNPNWTEFRAAIAFVKHSGIKHIQHALAEFCVRATVNISVGIDAGGTSLEGLADLLDAVQGRGDIWVFHNVGNVTFHPKIYLFKNQTQAELVIGSGNLTEGGLFTNYEANAHLRLELAEPEHSAFLADIETALDTWSTLQDGLCYALTHEFLRVLAVHGYVMPESQMRIVEARTRQDTEKTSSGLFKHVKIQAAPAIFEIQNNAQEAVSDGMEILFFEEPQAAEPQTGLHKVFLMTLQRTDVGIGQTTQGTSRRSPEIFIPLAARDADPLFWGWQDSFVADPSKPHKMDRRGVKMRIGTEIVEVNMMTWPDKSDFRLRCETLRSAGAIGDILYLERSDGSSGFSYYVEVIPQATRRYAEYLAYCKQSVRNSVKRWGYIAE